MNSMQKRFTERLVLEPQDVDHAHRLFDLFQDHNLYQFIDRNPHESRQKRSDDIKFIINRQTESHPERWLNWVLISVDAKQPLARSKSLCKSKTPNFFWLI